MFVCSKVWVSGSSDLLTTNASRWKVLNLKIFVFDFLFENILESPNLKTDRFFSVASTSIDNKSV